MSCPDHPDAGVALSVPASYREYAPTQASRITQCERCLRIWPGGEQPQSPTQITPIYPEGDSGVGAVLLIGLLASLATNREQIESLVTTLESEGVDVFLLLERLAADETLEPAVDLPRRRQQLIQLLSA